MWAHEYWIDEATPGGSTSSSGLLAGVFVGIAIGAAVSLMFAPAPGAEMRGRVKDSAQRVGRRVAEAYDGASHAVGDVVAKSRRAMDAGREAFQNARTADTRTGAVDAPLT